MNLSTTQALLPEGVEMPLTPDEIANKTFPSVLRGYAKWEVDEFLKDVALDYQRALGLAEWAMQRSASLASEPPTSEVLAADPTPELNHDWATLGRSPHGSDLSTLPPPVPSEQAAAQYAQEVDKLGEHLRYLAILVNHLNQRVDSLEAPRPQPTPTSTRGEMTAALAARLATVTSTANPPTTSDDQPKVTSSEWWPTESPLWVVSRGNGATSPGVTPPRG